MALDNGGDTAGEGETGGWEGTGIGQEEEEESKHDAKSQQAGGVTCEAGHVHSSVKDDPWWNAL